MGQKIEATIKELNVLCRSIVITVIALYVGRVVGMIIEIYLR